jgi:hypothetical protein
VHLRAPARAIRERNGAVPVERTVIDRCGVSLRDAAGNVGSGAAASAVTWLARGAEWSYLTPQEAADLGKQWVELFGGKSVDRAV